MNFEIGKLYKFLSTKRKGIRSTHVDIYPTAAIKVAKHKRQNWERNSASFEWDLRKGAFLVLDKNLDGDGDLFFVRILTPYGIGWINLVAYENDGFKFEELKSDV